ncbi:hypothetical protein BHE74_00044393 [Ensete ventricosum]|nr:hypothetical protein BHE74_00044393 [Ensete ventricosum]
MGCHLSCTVTRQVWSHRHHDEPSHLFGKAKRHGCWGDVLVPSPYYFTAFSYSVHFFPAIVAVSLSSPVLATPTSLTIIPSFSPDGFPSRSDVFCLLHSESQSIEILAHRFRVLSHPSGDFV